MELIDDSRPALRTRVAKFNLILNTRGHGRVNRIDINTKMAGPWRRTLLLVGICSLLVYNSLPGPGSLPKGEPKTGKNDPVFSRTIIAVGDLHGDFPNALQVLKMSGVIDEDKEWTGNVDFLVQTGDIIDRFVESVHLFVYAHRTPKYLGVTTPFNFTGLWKTSEAKHASPAVTS